MTFQTGLVAALSALYTDAGRMAGAKPIQEATTMKRKDITREAIRRSSVRAAAASVAIENRAVPVGYVRTERVERLLAARKQTA